MEKYTLCISNMVNKRTTAKRVQIIVTSEEDVSSLIESLRILKQLSKDTDYILQKDLVL